jgi:mannose-6-phosphate isomerase
MLPDNTPLYPLKFEPIYKEKVWGGRGLEKLGRKLPGDATTRIGESWEVTDLSISSPSGGGGGAERSIVSNGQFRGTSLHELITRYGQKLLGRLPLNASGNFPFLFKYLDIRENVSVQVHPTSAYVRNHPETSVKPEAWYVVDAEPGAVVYKGIREGVTPQQFRDAIVSGKDSAVEGLLIKVPAKRGDCHYLPSGTCHAVGAGVLSAEIQTASDTTFRVFDWGRTDRALHIDQAVQCIEFGPPDVCQYETHLTSPSRIHDTTRLVACEYFCIDKVHATRCASLELAYDEIAVWMVLEGSGQIDPNNGTEPVEFCRGETFFIPASLSNVHVKINREAVWLEITFPPTSATRY